jgi:hypothetical protein
MELGHDKLGATFLAFIQLAAARISLLSVASPWSLEADFIAVQPPGVYQSVK